MAQDPEVLSVSNLSVKLGGELILDNLSFSVKRGTTLAVVGPNGAGKTTLFRVLLGLVPYTGKVEWHGKARVGYVPQNFATTDVPITVEEFLSFKCKVDYTECLGSVSLDRSILKKRLNVLSGGEIQRVLIAWAIVDKPDVLLFDEPTANVDIGSEETIYETLNKLEEDLGITVMIISHELHVIFKYSDYTLAINKKLVFFGESKTLDEPDLLMQLFGSKTILAGHEHR